MRPIICFLVLCLGVSIAFAGPEAQFHGVVNSDETNIRVDSTISSAVICKINKGEQIEAVKELFEWYKIILPSSGPAYIKKSFTFLLPEDKNFAAKTAKVEKDNVNIRLGPNESASVIGKANKNEVISILSETDGWYKILPTQNCFGWINKKFVDRIAVLQKEIITQNKSYPQTQKNIILEGTITPYGKVFGRKATHKLETKDNRTYLLKGNKKNLDDLNYQKVKVTGIIISSGSATIIEVKKLEIAQ